MSSYLDSADSDDEAVGPCLLSEAEVATLRAANVQAKESGNSSFNEKQFERAVEFYSVSCPPCQCPVPPRPANALPSPGAARSKSSSL